MQLHVAVRLAVRLVVRLAVRLAARVDVLLAGINGMPFWTVRVPRQSQKADGLDDYAHPARPCLFMRLLQRVSALGGLLVRGEVWL